MKQATSKWPRGILSGSKWLRPSFLTPARFKLPEIFSETSAWGSRVGHDLAIEQQWLSPHRSLGKAVSAGSRETQPAQSLLYQMHEEPCLLSAKGGQGRRSPKRAGRATCDGRWTPHPACIRPLSRL